MIYTDLTKKAMRIAFDAHKDQVDKAGLPYIFHPYHIAEQMTDEISFCVALLHDIVEDTTVTFDELTNRDIPNEIINILQLLTHEDTFPYMEYIEKIKRSGNKTAIAVKLADLRHNSDKSRLIEADGDSLKRIEKYEKAIALLEDMV